MILAILCLILILGVGFFRDSLPWRRASVLPVSRGETAWDIVTTPVDLRSTSELSNADGLVVPAAPGSADETLREMPIPRWSPSELILSNSNGRKIAVVDFEKVLASALPISASAEARTKKSAEIERLVHDIATVNNLDFAFNGTANSLNGAPVLIDDGTLDITEFVLHKLKR